METVIFIYIVFAFAMLHTYSTEKNATFEIDLIKGFYFGANYDSIETEEYTVSYLQVMFFCVAFTIKYIKEDEQN